MRGNSFLASASGNLVRKIFFSLFRGGSSNHSVDCVAPVSDQFSLSLLRHELRTPLVGMLGMSELLLKSGLNGEQRHLLLALEESGRQMQRLVDRMGARDRAYIDTSLAPNKPFDGLRFMEQIVRAHWPAASAKGIDLLLSFDCHLPVQWISDPCYLRQALDNLLANAIKFTHCGFVLVEARRWGGAGSGPCGLELRLTDTGIGIAPEDSRRIYSVHEQGGGEVAHLYGGSGLGLAVCQELAARLGGRLQHESIHSGGVCFKMSLPRIAQAAAAEADQLRPRLLAELKCRLALGDPLNGVVQNLLGRMGVAVDCVEDRMQHTLSGQIDALFCHSARIAEPSWNVQAFGAKSRPLLLWRECVNGVSGPGREREFKAVALPQPILRSNLEPLLLQLILQRKLQNLA
ncbi:MAG TPA: HAMP domain-containing sensor histidine kinase [Xanthomonadales bacterium]|nr:HAMP domain-containing sensor histidine kinase [Xanthomonadales bacterium]